MSRSVQSLSALGVAATWWLATAFGPRFEPAGGWGLTAVAAVAGAYALLTAATAWTLGAATVGALRDRVVRRVLADARLPWPLLLSASAGLGITLWRTLPGDPLGRGWLAAASAMTLFVGGVVAAHLALAWRRRFATRPPRPSRPSITPTPA